MAISINSNSAALAATRRVADVTSAQGRVFERLSSGLRINRASDDAAGLAIASTLDANRLVYTQAIRNGNDAISALNIAQGGLDQFSTILTRLNELATQAANGTFSFVQRMSIDREGSALVEEFNRIAKSTRFNGQDLLSSGSSAFTAQLGYGVGGTLRVSTSEGLRRTVGSGSFSAGVAQGVNTNRQIATGDFFGDGNISYAGVTGVNNVRVMRGDGAGNFAVVNIIPTGGAASLGVVSGDFDGSGSQQLAVSLDNGTIELYKWNGAAFALTSTVTVDPGVDLVGLSAADINSDGRLDLVAAGSSTNSVYTVLNNGGNSFSLGQTITTPAGQGNVASFALGDFDGDGGVDVAIGGATATGIFIYKNNGSGAFTYQSTLATAGTSNYISTGDFNGDGRDDIIGNRGDVFTNQGNGSFTKTQVLGAGAFSDGYYVVDWNNDGISDLINEEGTVYENNGAGSFSAVSSISLSGVSRAFAFADFNKDGVLDLVNGFGGGTEMLTGLGTQTTALQRFDLSTRTSALSALDQIKAAFTRLSSQIGSLGASMSRLQVGISTLAASAENFAAASGRIKDADIAQESAELIRTNILRESAASVLSQIANQPRLASTLLSLI